MSAKNSILDRIDQLLFAVTKAAGAATTLDGDAAKDQKVIPVASTVGFAVGDSVRLGSGEDTERVTIASIQAGVSLTAEENLRDAHVTGEAAVQQTVYDLGPVTDGGVTTTGAAQSTDVQVATQRLAYAIAQGYVDLTAEGQLPGLTIHNFALATGTPFAKIAGDGSDATPYSLVTDGSDFGSLVDACLIAIGVVKDGSLRRVELWGVDFDYTGISITLARGQIAPVAFKAVASNGGKVSQNASALVGVTTLRPSKGKVFDHIDEAVLPGDAVGGGTSTVATAAAAGDRTLHVADATNYAEDEWVRINADDLVEFHQIASIDAVNDVLTFKSVLLRAQAVGTAVVSQTLSALAGIAEAGPTVSVGGSVTPIRFAEKRTSAGVKPGPATVTVGVPLTDFSLETIARAYGIPQSAIAAGVLPLSDEIGTAQVDGLFLKAVTQDGTVVWINVWGCSQDVSNAVMTMAQSGVQSMPFTLRPGSGLHLQQA